jgi:hypothetical protein
MDSPLFSKGRLETTKENQNIEVDLGCSSDQTILSRHSKILSRHARTKAITSSLSAASASSYQAMQLLCLTIGVGVDRKWIIIEEGKRQYVLCVLVLVKG